MANNEHKQPQQKLVLQQQQQHDENHLTNLNAHSRVYCETTLPLEDAKTVRKFSTPKIPDTAKAAQTETTTTTKIKTKTLPKQPQPQPQRRRTDKSDLGENFVAPDGGWAWIVCIAAGISNLCIYPALQQFGFLFRERMHVLGMTSSQVTTIINTNPAISACTGLLNGPMFRRFTFRQVGIAGSTLVFVGLMFTAFSESFLGYMINYALVMGFGMGISVSASSLAINTYFKNKRRRACGFSWTITGLGPIFLPFIVTALLSYYGVQGTVLLAAGFSLHSLVCALIYQPVRYHTKSISNSTAPLEPEYLCVYCTLKQKHEKGIFSSQYLYQDDDEDKPGYEIIEPGTPMLSRANDGWFGSKLSLANTKPRRRTFSGSKDLEYHGILKKVITDNSVLAKQLSEETTNHKEELEEEEEEEEFLKPNNFRRERDEMLRQSPSKGNFKFYAGRTEPDNRPTHCTCAEERALMELQQQQQQQTATADSTDTASNCSTQKSISFAQKVVAFFDLDLLRDFTYVNLVMGLTIINFGELNFSILTPFILDDFGLTTSQMTTAIAALSSMDISTRFLVPFLTEKISWDNRVFFLIGVVGIALGRTVVACTRSYPVILSSFAVLGICKGIRTIFWPLVIPSYVPLKRLPAASGLQLLISGLFTLACGPFVGLVRDRFNFAITLHCLNMLSFTAAASWALEALVRRHRRKHKPNKIVA